MYDFEVIGEGTVDIGRSVTIGKDVKFIIPKGSNVKINDYVTIGDSVKFVLESGNVTIGDWTTLHSNTLLLSTLGVDIGQHCWFGQNVVLDGTGMLTIRNGVRVGMFSQIWTHVAAGEQIEGCTLYGTNPVFIDDDAWLVGTCTVGSGVSIGKKAICMNGSNVTKNVSERTVVAGLPAKLRSGLSFYKDISLTEKFDLLSQWLEEFTLKRQDIEIKRVSDNLIVLQSNLNKAYFFKHKSEYANKLILEGESKFEIESKAYSKSFNSLEHSIMKFLSGNKARFYS
jgi:acetyltransferase-like isoleucine patch superfamily enzyme